MRLEKVNRNVGVAQELVYPQPSENGEEIRTAVRKVKMMDLVSGWENR